MGYELNQHTTQTKILERAMDGLSTLERDAETNERRRSKRTLEPFSNFFGVKCLEHVMLSTAQPRIHVNSCV